MSSLLIHSSYTNNHLTITSWFFFVIGFSPPCKLASTIRNSFLDAAFRQSFVKILVNPKGFTAFCASAWQKSAIQKIFDLKEKIFIWIFGGWARWKPVDFRWRNAEKPLKRTLSGYFGLYSPTYILHLYGLGKGKWKPIFPKVNRIFKVNNSFVCC